MTNRRPPPVSGRGATRTPLVLVFGEDENDRQSIRILASGLRPDLAPHIVPRRNPILLVKGLKELKARQRAVSWRRTVEAESRVRGVLAAIMHEDCDEREPAHLLLSAEIERRYSSPACRVIPATPAWELEAWWFLWPDAAQALVSSWRRPDKYIGKNVGLIADAKEAYRRATSPIGRGSGQRVYRESDSPLLAAIVVQLGLLHHPLAVSGSFSEFADRVKKL